ncbi:hypothetical protein GGF31_000302 [Allomyces arbusculus]|nr:hypothetical protein GGF31_000302 [Allomyces arbusculus]
MDAPLLLSVQAPDMVQQPLVHAAFGSRAPNLTYLQVHLYLTLPAVAVLAWLARPFLWAHDRFKMVFLMALAVVYAFPWDHWVIMRGAWGYCESCVIGTIGGAVPIEEAAFFVIQTVASSLVGVLVYQACGQSPAVVQAAVALKAIKSPRTGRTLRGFGIALCTIAWAVSMYYVIYGPTNSFYMSAIVMWATPILALQWWMAGPYIWRLRKPALVSVVLATAALSALDWYAIRAGAWEIGADAVIGIYFYEHLPLEEVVFFALSNVMLVLGTLACDRTLAIMKFQGTLNERKHWVREMYRCTLLPDAQSAPASDPDLLEDTVLAANLIAKGSLSFHLASLLYPWDVRLDIHAIYAFCRVTDDIADATWMPAIKRKAKLDLAKQLIMQAFGAAPTPGKPEPGTTFRTRVQWDRYPELTVTQLAACRSIARVHDACGLPVQPVLDLLKGYAWDLDADKPITNVPDLIQYSRYVAGTVGELTTHVMVAAADRARRHPRKPDPARAKLIAAAAVDMGVGLQLLNIARDLITDARLGRCYVPKDFWPASTNFSRAALMDRMAQRDCTPGDHAILHRVAGDLTALATSYLTRAATMGVPLLPREFRLPVRVAADVYAAIGKALREAAATPGAEYPERVVVPASTKVAIALKLAYLPQWGY